MPSVTISISEEQERRLRERAGEAGMTPEELLRAHVEQWLTAPEREFRQAASYVLQKNAELYRRLA